jgi:hypothetical protein
MRTAECLGIQHIWIVEPALYKQDNAKRRIARVRRFIYRTNYINGFALTAERLYIGSDRVADDSPLQNDRGMYPRCPERWLRGTIPPHSLAGYMNVIIT